MPNVRREQLFREEEQSLGQQAASGSTAQQGLWFCLQKGAYCDIVSL